MAARAGQLLAARAGQLLPAPYPADVGLLHIVAMITVVLWIAVLDYSDRSSRTSIFILLGVIPVRGGELQLNTSLNQRHSGAHSPTIETHYLVTTSVQGRCCDDCVSETAGVLLRDGKGARDNVTILDHDAAAAQ